MKKLTMKEVVRHTSSVYPDKVCLIRGDEERTYKDFDERTTKLAIILQKFGIKSKDHVAVLSPNDIRYVEVYYANAKIGAVTCPVVHVLSPFEIINVTNNAESSILFVHETMIEIVLSIRSQLKYIEKFIIFYFNNEIKTKYSNEENFYDYEEIINKENVQNFTEVEIEENEIALMFITSGTTGSPKAASYSHRSLIELIYRNLSRFNNTSRIALTNLCAWIGAVDLTITMLASGGTVILVETNEINHFFNKMLEHQVTHALFLPGVMHDVLKFNDEKLQQFAGHLEVLIYVGGPVPVRVIQQVRKRISVNGERKLKVIQAYGLTEAVGVSALFDDDHPIDPTPLQKKRLESCGRPLFGTSIKILKIKNDQNNNNEINNNQNEDQNNNINNNNNIENNLNNDQENGNNRIEGEEECERGEVGEIVVLVPSMMSGYYQGKKKPLSGLTKEGWFRTGDVGYLDENSYLFLKDRKKDVIIPRTGINVYPREVEDVISWHPYIDEVAVVGQMDEEESGEEVVAFVVLKKGFLLSSKEIFEWCFGRLAVYKLPTRVIFIDEIPKSENRKVLKRVLQQIKS